jgi:hypothetical protein
MGHSSYRHCMRRPPRPSEEAQAWGAWRQTMPARATRPLRRFRQNGRSSPTRRPRRLPRSLTRQSPRRIPPRVRSPRPSMARGGPWALVEAARRPANTAGIEAAAADADRPVRPSSLFGATPSFPWCHAGRTPTPWRQWSARPRRSQPWPSSRRASLAFPFAGERRAQCRRAQGSRAPRRVCPGSRWPGRRGRTRPPRPESAQIECRAAQ